MSSEEIQVEDETANVILGLGPRFAPIQKPGKSKQDYPTPVALIEAVQLRFGILKVDLAATIANAVVPVFIPPEQDSLSAPWAKMFKGERCWLNPPFGNIGAWAAKCCVEGAEMRRHARKLTKKKLGRGRIFLLTPASIGANWFARHVNGHARVLALQGRLSFDGKNPYPKDCVISVFGDITPGFEVWDWEKKRGVK